MNEKNLESLKKQVMYTGFGNLLDIQLEDNMKKELPDFQLHHKHEFGKDSVDSTLNFRRSEQGNYFFNSYDVQLSKENAEPLKQSFYVSRPQEVTQKQEGAEDKNEWVNSTITLKEAYNLMEGRSVLKDFVSQGGEKYTNWISMDFKDTDDKGNYLIKKRPDFDLEAKVATLPIKELSNDQSKKELIDSLQKGNRQSVTVINEGVEQKFFLEASPQFKTVNRFEGTQRVAAQQRETNGQSAKQGNKETQKSESDDDSNRNKQKRSTKKGHGISS